jgi:ankyrin repeat protein
MISSRQKLVVALLISLPAISTCLIVWKVDRTLKQDRINLDLVRSVKNGDTARAVDLLIHGADPNAEEAVPDTRSARKKLWDMVRGKKAARRAARPVLILAAEGERGSGPAPDNNALIKALLEPGPRQDSPVLVKALLDAGASINARDVFGRTALITAANNRHLTSLRLLLERGADVTLRDAGGEFTLTAAGTTYKSHLSGRTALESSYRRADIPAMKLLLQHGAHIDDRDDDGATLLIRSATLGEVQLSQFMLSNGAMVNAADKDSRTALMLAASSEYASIVALLVKHGADINARDKEGKTPMMYSIEGAGDDPGMVRLLLKLGADAGIKSATGDTALSLARRRHYMGDVRVLVMHKRSTDRSQPANTSAGNSRAAGTTP